MPPTKTIRSPPALLRRLFGRFAFRPRLLSSAAAGLVAFALLSLLGSSLQASLRAVIAWDLACVAFIVLVLLEMKTEEADDIRRVVAQQDEGQGLILLVVLLAAGTSLAAVGLELSLAKDDHGLFKTLRVAIAGLTVALSWFTVQLVFALHYAHEYYAPDKSTPEADDVVGGLDFPGGEPPDYWDFLHFSVIIGVANQTADIAFSSRKLRHIGTVHGMVAFTFNTVVLALSINLLAGLF